MNFSVLLVTKKFKLVFNLESIDILHILVVKDFKEFEEKFKFSINKITVFGYHLYTTPPSN